MSVHPEHKMLFEEQFGLNSTIHSENNQNVLERLLQEIAMHLFIFV